MSSALFPTSLPPLSGWATPGSAPAAADSTAYRPASDWFNSPLADGPPLLRIPLQGGATDADVLCQRFLACLNEPGTV